MGESEGESGSVIHIKGKRVSEGESERKREGDGESERGTERERERRQRAGSEPEGSVPEFYYKTFPPGTMADAPQETTPSDVPGAGRGTSGIIIKVTSDQSTRRSLTLQPVLILEPPMTHIGDQYIHSPMGADMPVSLEIYIIPKPGSYTRHV